VITHLGLDSSVLVGAGWPQPSVALRNVITSCAELNVPVLIPQLVLWELEAVWIRTTASVVKDARESMRNVVRRLPTFNAALGSSPDDAMVAATYHEAVKALEVDWKWTVSPLPPVSLDDAVMRSVKYEPPFADADSGFRDSLIVWSLLQSLAPGNVLGLAAADSAFAQPRMKDAAAAANVKLQIFKSVPEAWTTLEGMVRLSTHFELLAFWEKQNNVYRLPLRLTGQGFKRFSKRTLKCRGTRTASTVRLKLHVRADSFRFRM
jgi:hypothetical protein